MVFFVYRKRIGFYVKNQDEYKDFISEIKKEIKETNSFIQMYEKETKYEIRILKMHYIKS